MASITIWTQKKIITMDSNVHYVRLMKQENEENERETNDTYEHRNTREKFSRPSTHTRQCEKIANDIQRHMHLLYAYTRVE